MSDFQGQFIPDGRTLICKGALTIGLGFDSGDSLDARKQEPDMQRSADHRTWF